MPAAQPPQASKLLLQEAQLLTARVREIAQEKMASLAQELCHHCGLPVGALGRRENDRPFCCYGCYLAWRIVGEPSEGGAGPLATILIRLGIAGVLAMNVMMISLLLYSDLLTGIGAQATELFRWALLGLSAPVFLILGFPFLRGAAQDLRRGTTGLDGLIAIGALAGFGVSAYHVIQGQGHIYFDTVTMLLVLITVGRLIEASARTEASRALKQLVQLKPVMARIISESGDREVPAEQVRVGDRVRVRPGEQVPIDGIILSGASSVQEAALTGEFNPRRCGPRELVFGGSANGEGEIIIEATVVGPDALLSKIARLVQQAQLRKAPVERLADRMSAAFIPIVLAIATGALIYWLWRGDASRGGMSALAALVVACPCALGLATPLAICIAIARAARAGILVRAGEVLENLSRVTSVIFDKTGTLTEGRPVLKGIACCADGLCNEDEALSWLASLESASEHAIAKSLVSAAKSRDLKIGPAEGFRAFPGEGAVAQVELNGNSREVWAGTADFLAQHGFDLSCAERLPLPGPAETLVFVAWEAQVRARACVADAIRADAAEAVRELQRLGIAVSMLSGDRQQAAEHLARSVGITQVKAGCSPVAKIEEVRRRKQAGQAVAVVGDGINDAPALAEADVGIAMGGGADLAKEAGEVTLLRGELQQIPWLLRLTRHTYRVIWQNLMWAFGYNLIALLLAFFGFLHPLIAALVMLGSSIYVIHNSLRLARPCLPGRVCLRHDFPLGAPGALWRACPPLPFN